MEISLTDLVNGNVVNQEWSGTGVFDQLMSAVNKNIEVQYQKGRITGSDYAQAYVQSLQATLQQAVEFLLRRDLTEAQINSEIESIKLKQLQIKAEKDKLEAELEKQWGYDVTRDADDELVLGPSTGEGKIDKEIILADKQATLLDTQEQGEQFKVDYLMPKELDQITAQVMAVEKDVEVKEQQKANLIIEEKVAAQRIVGRAQSTVIKE